MGQFLKKKNHNLPKLIRNIVHDLNSPITIKEVEYS